MVFCQDTQLVVLRRYSLAKLESFTWIWFTSVMTKVQFPELFFLRSIPSDREEIALSFHTPYYRWQIPKSTTKMRFVAKTGYISAIRCQSDAFLRAVPSLTITAASWTYFPYKDDSNALWFMKIASGIVKIWHVENSLLELVHPRARRQDALVVLATLGASIPAPRSSGVNKLDRDVTFQVPYLHNALRDFHK